MYNTLKFLEKNLTYLLIFYLIVQLIYITFFPVNYQSDSHYYYRLVEECVDANSFYPAPKHLYEDYISAPLYINLLFILLQIYNSPFAIGLLNILLNFLQIFMLYKISEKIFNKRTANLVTIIYIFYLNNLGMVLLNYTELFFGVLIFLSIYFYFKESAVYSFLAGIFVAASIGVRPLGWALLAAYFFIYLYFVLKKIKTKRNFFHLSFGVLIFIFSFGIFNQFHFGKFIYTSTTGPVNLLIGANDDATGAYNDDVFEKGKAGFILDSTKKTYIEKGDIWKIRALNWVSDNPVKWISLIPIKTAYIFLWDDIAISPLMNLQDWDLFHIAKHLILKKSFNGLMPKSGIPEKIIYLTMQSLNYIYYFLIIFLIFSTVIILKKERSYNIYNVILVLFSAFGIFITVIAYGLPRYKYPFIIALMPYAGYKLNLFLNNKQV